MGPELIWHLGTYLAKNTQPSKWPICQSTSSLNGFEKSMDFKKMLINFRKKSYSGIIPFVCVGKEEILKYM